MKKQVIIMLAALVAAGGCSEPLESFVMNGMSAPVAPGKPLLAGSVAGIGVSWGAVDGAESYHVYYGTSPEPPVDAVYSGGGTQTLIGDFEKDTPYFVWVRAQNIWGLSPLSGRAEITLSLVPPEPVLTAGAGSLTVSWPPVALAVSYNVYYSESATCPDEPHESGIAGTSVTISGLANGTTYYVWVEAVDAGGEKKISGVRSQIISFLVPPEPEITAQDGGLAVSWPEVPRAVFYNVYYAASTVRPESPQQPGITETSVTISGLVNETAYYVWVEAIDAEGTKEISAPVSGVPEIQFAGEWMVENAATFAEATAAIQAGGGSAYCITLTNSVMADAVSISSSSPKTIVIRGDGTVRILYNGSNATLFTVGGNTTLILANNVTLNSNSKSSRAVLVSGGKLVMRAGSVIEGTSGKSGGGVEVSGGTFTMSGGAIRGNTAISNGGGVTIGSGGTFTMSGGTISGNTTPDKRSGGGVAVGSGGGTFTMSGGTIRGNTAYSGGGVIVYDNGTFTMEGGVISGNTASSPSSNSYGGGVFVYSDGTFTKSGGGTIYGGSGADANTAANGKAVYVNSSKVKVRNTTAGPGVSLNSNISGTAGGWE